MTDFKNNGDPGFYVVGGTMRPDAPSYVERCADKTLYQALRQGEFCYVLTSRQMGKSSLMIRTSAQLRETGIGVAVLDLTAIGQNLSIEQWYAGLIVQIGQRLCLEDEIVEFWKSQTWLGPMQGWVKAIRSVVLPRNPKRLVIFIDEIDTVKSLPFSTDEFFAGIRECYNQRNEDMDLQRITFCLLGVATPSDLIRNTDTTPFNIGRRIELEDFQDSEAVPLGVGLRLGEKRGAKVLKRILYWTGGHPYLTQRLCLAVSESKTIRNDSDIDSLCADMFFSNQARERDNNLLFVRERLLRSGKDLRSEKELSSLLDFYAKVRSRQTIKDDGTNPLVSILQLSGIIRTENGHLKVRNRIYAEVFDKTWIADNMPHAEILRQKIAYRRGVWRTAIVSALILALVGSLALIAFYQSKRAEREADANRRLLDYTQLKLAPQESQNVSTKEVEDLLTATLYHTQIKLALQEWENSNIERVGELLESSIPLQGVKDWRSFEWYWLQHITHGESYPLQEKNRIVSVAFLKDGQTLAIGEVSRAKEEGDDEYVIKFYDLKAKRDIAPFTVPAGKNFDLIVFSPDKHKVAMDGPNRDVVLCDLDKGSRSSLRGHSSAITTIAFSPDGRYLASGDFEGYVRLWNAANGEHIRSIKLKRESMGLTFSPDGRWLATTDETTTMRIWDVATGQEQQPFALNQGALVRAAFFPDGKRLVATSKDGTLYLVEFRTRRMLAKLTGHSREVKAIAFSSDSRFMVTGSMDRTVMLWDMVQQSKSRTIRGHGSEITSVNWSPDNKSIVTGSLDGTIKVWDVEDKYAPNLPAEKVTMYMATAFSSDNDLIAFGIDINSAMKLWNVSNGKELIEFDKTKFKILCASISPNQRLLATGGRERLVKIWDVDTGKLLHTLSGHTGPVHGVVFSPDGSLLISGGEDRALIIWDAISGKKISSFDTEVDNYYRAVFSPDGKSVASARRDGSVVLWDVDTRTIRHTLIGHTDQVRAIAFSNSGRQLATGGKDNTIRLWDVTTGQELKKPAHLDYVQRVAFSPDDKRLVTGGVEGSVKLWDVVLWQELMNLEGHLDKVTSITFSSDGKSLATSSDDGTLRLWRAAITEGASANHQE